MKRQREELPDEDQERVKKQKSDVVDYFTLIPKEIWRHIIDECPVEYLPYLLSVSSDFKGLFGESEYERLFYLRWQRRRGEEIGKKGRFYTGSSNFVDPSLCNPSTAYRSRYNLFQEIERSGSRVEMDKIEFENRNPDRQCMLAYQMFDGKKDVIYEPQPDEYAVTEEERKKLADCAYEHFLIGPSSAILRVRAEHRGDSYNYPNDERFCLLRLMVYSHLTKAWCTFATSFLNFSNDEFVYYLYPTLDSVLSILFGERISMSQTHESAEVSLRLCMRASNIFEVIKAMLLPDDCREAYDDECVDNKSPSYERLFE